MAEDGDYILDAINNEFVHSVVNEKAGHSTSFQPEGQRDA
jgi:hypothetical protein